MICNATPLISLSKVGELELLKNLFYKLIITSVIKEEVLVEGMDGYFELIQALSEGWIEVVNPIRIGEWGLDKGEQSVISLAREKKDKLIIDDNSAFKVARALNIDVIRTTTVILMAVKKAIINKKRAIQILNKLLESGYYLAPKYYAVLLEKLR